MLIRSMTREERIKAIHAELDRIEILEDQLLERLSVLEELTGPGSPLCREVRAFKERILQ